MGSGDILVKVGPQVMTKADAELRADLLARMFVFANPSAPVSMAEKIRRSRLPVIVRGFETKALFLEKAKRENHNPTAEDYESVRAEFRTILGGAGTNRFENFRKGLDGRLCEVLAEEIVQNATINALWRQEFPDLYRITDKDVQDVEAEVDEMNKKAAKLSKDSHAKARLARERVAKEDFAKVADEMSALKREDDELWEDGIHPEELEGLCPEIAKTLRSMKPGDISDILELDDGLHIVKLYERTGSGSVALVNENPETLKLGHIVIQLPMEYRAAPREQIIQETRNLRLKPVRQKLASELRREIGVSYPSGTNLWPKASRKDPRVRSGLSDFR